MEDVQLKKIYINADSLFPLMENWDKIGQNMRYFVIEKGSIKIDGILYYKQLL